MTSTSFACSAGDSSITRAKCTNPGLASRLIEIYKEPEKFRAASQKLETEAGKLAAAARSGDQNAVKVAFGEAQGIPVSMGNPHFVVFMDDFAPGWQGDAAEIGKHHDFKYGINVDFVKLRDAETLDVRFYERGVGETQSSGTGSCAAAVAAIFAKKAQSPVKVHAPGGPQTVRWEDQVFLRGPAQIICRGEFLS